MNATSSLSPTAQAILLLTSYFSKASKEAAKPLTNTEWGRFAEWLKGNSTNPADLLGSNTEALLSNYHDSKISSERLLALLNRGHSLALAMEKWQRAGLWVVTRSDTEYPWRLKQRLKKDSPPVLFGCGNKSFLNAGGLAVIGSRKANPADLAFTEQVGAKAASEGIAIVSGGARGVDEASMLGAIRQEGIVIGVMADSLLRAATSSKWRKALMNDHAVLISPFYPEAGFSTGNAMARNKYIYCLADCSLVIHSGKTGGTISGAKENIKKCWVPLWVKRTDDKDAANADLVADGGLWLEAKMPSLTITDLMNPEAAQANRVSEKQVDLFSVSEGAGMPSESEPVIDTVMTTADSTASEDSDRAHIENTLALSEPTDEPQAETSNAIDFYQLFSAEIKELANEPVTVDELIERTQLHKSQLNEWLKRAVEEGVVKKLSRPVRYQTES